LRLIEFELSMAMGSGPNVAGAVADHASIQAGAYPEVVGHRKKR
jgi:hypothetical protein